MGESPEVPHTERMNYKLARPTHQTSPREPTTLSAVLCITREGATLEEEAVMVMGCYPDLSSKDPTSLRPHFLYLYITTCRDIQSLIIHLPDRESGAQRRGYLAEVRQLVTVAMDLGLISLPWVRVCQASRVGTTLCVKFS